MMACPLDLFHLCQSQEYEEWYTKKKARRFLEVFLLVHLNQNMTMIGMIQ